MTVKERLLQSLESCSESELAELETFAAFIQFRDIKPPPRMLDEDHLREAFAEFAQEDRELAEAGLEDYHRGLQAEDSA